MRDACDVTKGDLLVAVGVQVESVMVEGDTTYVSWGEKRLMDTFHKGDVVLDIYPSKCPNCGFQLVRPEHE
jgi:predicted Zn-ribbon and HTH transcriptional regulator